MISKERAKEFLLFNRPLLDSERAELMKSQFINRKERRKLKAQNRKRK